MKILRLNKRWSQEQLAHMSGLNVRTIQRVEKGKSVGLETLKSLAAVFEISTDELIHAIENEKQPSQKEDIDIVKAQSLRNNAHEKVKSIKYFYASSAFLIAIFLLFMLPNYNGGENLGPLILVFISFSVLVAGHACLVFQPFGEKWEQEKVSKILSQQSNNSSSTSEH
jgi:transcriptional regulator with XRE-family HTH domain